MYQSHIVYHILDSANESVVVNLGQDLFEPINGTANFAYYATAFYNSIHSSFFFLIDFIR